MAEEDLDLTKTCPSCASPNISYNKEGQIICRDCGYISPAGKVFGFGIYSKIKGIFRAKKKKSKKIKKKGKLKIKSILKRKKKAKKAKKKISKKRKIKKKSKRKRKK